MADTIITRKEALAQGLNRYFTGKPCKHGHLTERQASSGLCLICMAVNTANFRAKARQSGGTYIGKPCKYGHSGERFTNGDCVECNAEKMKRRYDADPAKHYAYYKQPEPKARRKQPEVRAREKAWFQQWRVDNPEKYAIQNAQGKATRRARKLKIGGTHTAADLAEILKAQKYRCAYCRADLRKTPKQLDHIEPLVGEKGSNSRAGVQWLCAPCNRSKGASDPIDFARDRGLLI